MSVEALPLSVQCNIACAYCYQQPMRSGDKKRPYDLEKMKATLASEAGPNGSFTVFGGEPLLLPLPDLEELLRFSYERSGRSNVQTNATLLTEEHVQLFLKYNTSVGVSMDGPDELNDTRWAGSLERTREATAKSQAALERVLEAGLSASLIITLTTINARGARLDRLVGWLGRLGGLGLRDARLHLLEVDAPRAAELLLSEEESVQALMRMHREEPFLGIRFDLFREMLALLRGKDENVTCVWNACDPWTTAAVRGVGPQGERLNCGRTNKDSRNWLKATTPSFRRQLVLYNTPQEHGGCQGCRFFMACKGFCPGDAEQSDYRRRSAHCGTLFRVFEQLEAHLVAVREAPVSLRPDRTTVEGFMLREFEVGKTCSVERALKLAAGQASPSTDQNGNRPHGDVPHGDHYDSARRR